MLQFTNQMDFQGILCLLVSVEHFHIGVRSHSSINQDWRCVDQNNYDVYKMKNLPRGFFKEKKIISGETKLWISRGKRVKGNIFGRLNVLYLSKKKK